MEGWDGDIGWRVGPELRQALAANGDEALIGVVIHLDLVSSASAARKYADSPEYP